MATLAFGSCNKQFRPQPLWPHILRRNPRLFVWAGDNVYHDTRRGATFTPAPLEQMKANYALQLAHPGYTRLRAAVEVDGTWDDHDYGLNDAGDDYANRTASQALFLDFLGEPEHSARRRRQGVFSSRELALHGGGTLKLILLDVRFHRSAYRRDGGGSMLGEDQWRWLEAQLRNSSAAAHVIVSGVQLLPEHRYIAEGWYRFAAERARLLELVLSSGARAPLLVSGDVHFAELSEARCFNPRGEAASLVELTTSGMTHGWGARFAYAPSAVPALGSLEGVAEGWVGWALLHLTQALMPFAYLQRDARDARPLYYAGINFGELELDGSRVVSRVLNEGGEVVLEASHSLQSLGAAAAAARDGPWRCEGHRGPVPKWRHDLALGVLVALVLSAVFVAPMGILCCFCRALRRKISTRRTAPSLKKKLS
ncbi:hypothetical protein AB1Y20_004899 [Prymnesium parvum]|uniref:PhoD-like phosphatase metallophosphatase domain-containing protein n=1 Tax=Prymnesium parvum TaxID=97485 RepID=A0AB34J0J7_PRYPA